MKKLCIAFAALALFAQPTFAKNVSDKRIKQTRSSALSSSASLSQTSEMLAGSKFRTFVNLYTAKPADANAMMTTITPSAKEIGSGYAFGGSLDIPVFQNRVFAGVRIESFSSSSDWFAIAPNVFMSGAVSGTPLMATGTYLHPIASGFSAGGVLGLGAALGYTGVMKGAATPNGNPVTETRFSATPFTGLISGVANYDFSRALGARFEMGYRLLSAKMDHDGIAGTPEINIDTSSPFFGFSVVYTL